MLHSELCLKRILVVFRSVAYTVLHGRTQLEVLLHGTAVLLACLAEGKQPCHHDAVFDCCCAMQALFEQAIADKTSQHFPLLWRCYMSYEICRGRYEAARRVLLRAVHTCPGAKALWLDGLHLLAEQVMQQAGHWHWAVFGHRTCVKCIPCHVHVAVQCLCIYTSAAGVKQDIQEPLTFLPPQFLGIVSHQSLACHNPIDAIHKGFESSPCRHNTNNIALL